MADNNVSDRIIARIRKMLALAKDAGATEGERDNALRMAHATLAKYNLELAEVETSDQHTDEPRGLHTDSFHGWPWARNISVSVAKLFFCRYVYSHERGRRGTRHYFIGRTSNAVTAAEVSKFIVESIFKEAGRRQRALAENNAWAREFAWGAALKVRDRVKELIDAATTPPPSATPGTELVLASIYQTENAKNEVVLNEHFTRLKAGRLGKGFSRASTGYAQGQMYGSTISLHRQVERKSP